MALIRLEQVVVRFGDVVALDSVDLVVRHAETLGVLGPSGCGKTTLLRVIAGLIKPDAGYIYFDGHDVTTLQPHQRGIGMVFESFALYPHLDTHENIAFPLRVRKQPDVETRVASTARRLSIDRAQLLERSPVNLAAGEQQRVALGRALITNPTILLLDEPLSNLDAHLRVRTRAELARLMDDLNTTAVYVTHDQQEATAVANRVAIMRAGRIVQIGTPGELRLRPANVFVAQFLGSPPMNVVPARVEGERLQIPGATGSIPLPPRYRHVGDGAVLAGMRPEHLRLDPDGLLQLTIRQVEPRLEQHSHLLHGSLDGERVTAQVADQAQVRVMETITLTVDPEHIQLFDPTNESRLD